LIALVISVYHWQNISDLSNINMEEIFKTLGLSEHLCPNRRNGFFAMVERIKGF
jgi:cysteine desulfuration protein SufE